MIGSTHVPASTIDGNPGSSAPNIASSATDPSEGVGLAHQFGDDQNSGLSGAGSDLAKSPDIETLAASYTMAKVPGGPTCELVKIATDVAIRLVTTPGGESTARHAGHLARQLIDDLLSTGKLPWDESMALVRLCNKTDADDACRILVDHSYKAVHGDRPDDNVETDILDGAHLDASGWPVNRFGQRFNIDAEKASGHAKEKIEKLRARLTAKGLLPGRPKPIETEMIDEFTGWEVVDSGDNDERDGHHALEQCESRANC